MSIQSFEEFVKEERAKERRFRKFKKELNRLMGRNRCVHSHSLNWLDDNKVDDLEDSGIYLVWQQDRGQYWSLVYVGQTTQPITKRLKEHVYHKSKVGKAMKKYKNSFRVARLLDETKKLIRAYSPVGPYDDCENILIYVLQPFYNQKGRAHWCYRHKIFW